MSEFKRTVQTRYDLEANLISSETVYYSSADQTFEIYHAVYTSFTIVEIESKDKGLFSIRMLNYPDKGVTGIEGQLFHSNTRNPLYWGPDNSIPNEVMMEAFLRLYG